MSNFVITDKEALLQTLADANRRVTGWFTAIPVSSFFERQAGSWSSSDNLDHLIRAVKPVALAMKMPKLVLRGLFGKPESPSRSYEEICAIYKNVLVKGARASGRYLPSQENSGNAAEEQKRYLLEKWTALSSELTSSVQNWTEADLDQFQLPHPLLGKLTAREMLFFTIYHNLRHASQEGD